jgi:two-component system sensor histidine kinase/response regulator
MPGICYYNIIPDFIFYVVNIDFQIVFLNLLLYLIKNIWVYHLMILFLLVIISYLLYTNRKVRKKEKFIDQFTAEKSPLAYSNILNSLLLHAPDFIYVKNKDSKFIIANEKLAKTVGARSWKELIGKTDHDYYPKDLANIFRLDELDVLNSGIPLLNKIGRGLNAKGKEIWVSSSKIPIKDEKRGVVGIVGIGRDITAQKLHEKELVKKSENLQEANNLLEERQEQILQQQEELKIQTEKILLERNNLLTLINAMPDSIYFKDRKSRFIIGNKYVASRMGTVPEMLVGKTDFDFYEKELAEIFYKDEQELMKTGNPLINKEEEGRGYDGNKAIISTTKVPLKDGKGNVIGIIGIGRDISRQKNVEKELIENSDSLKEINLLLEEKQEEVQQQSEELNMQTEHLMQVNNELEKLSIVASKTDNVIVIMDKNGDFEWVNSGFEKRYGMILNDFIRKNGSNIKETSNSENIVEIMDEILREKKALIYNSKSQDKDNNSIWFQTTMTPVLDENNEISQIILIDSDITKLKEAEDKISKNKEEIERQRDELRTLNATKDKFFSIIAHDLKNPFQSIIGFSDLLSRKYHSIEEEKKIEFIRLIKDSSNSAYVLLENLLDWAGTQTNKIKYRPEIINLIEIINENFQMFHVSLQKKNIRFIKPEDKEIKAFADYNMINTIFRNLLSNAIKFTPENGTITISASVKEKMIELIVADTGIGMDKKDIDKIFILDEFHSTEGTSGESGTGLGLIISREFAIMHGSELAVQSEKGKGTRFSFKLPLKAPSA